MIRRPMGWGRDRILPQLVKCLLSLTTDLTTTTGPAETELTTETQIIPQEHMLTTIVTLSNKILIAQAKGPSKIATGKEVEI